MSMRSYYFCIVLSLAILGIRNINFYVPTSDYTLIESQMTVVQARRACTRLGMTLVGIESKYEMNYIAMLLSKYILNN